MRGGMNHLMSELIPESDSIDGESKHWGSCKEKKKEIY
jgi:hypothetical protein